MDPNSGEFIKQQLERFGSDVGHSHDVSFWLYFEDGPAARLALGRGLKAGLDGEVTESAVPDRETRWLCLLVSQHIPDEHILDRVCEFCTRLAEDIGGHFDGWKARLELTENHTLEIDHDH